MPKDLSLEILRPGAELKVKLHAAAQTIFAVLQEQPPERPFVLALCGGRSVVGILQALLEESAHQPRELLRRIHFFMVDERIVPLSHSDSNFGGLKQQLFDTLVEQGTILKEQLHPLLISAEDAAGACERYMRELESLGGAFTVVVLGMGEDGHVAGLFPRHVALTTPGRRFIPFFDSPKPPAARVTASSELVTDAALGILLALGEGKRAAWDALMSGTVISADCPAKILASMERCIVVTDL